MRFVLDNDVDVGVQRAFVKAGHECWRGAEAGVTDVVDESVYADKHCAVVVTHDREFTERRKRNTFGQHVRFTCQQPDACSVLRVSMDELIAMLEEHPVVVIELSSSRLKWFPERWD